MFAATQIGSSEFDLAEADVPAVSDWDRRTAAVLASLQEVAEHFGGYVRVGAGINPERFEAELHAHNPRIDAVLSFSHLSDCENAIQMLRGSCERGPLGQHFTHRGMIELRLCDPDSERSKKLF